MGISRYPSSVTLPEMNPPYPSLREFLSIRFPAVSAERWDQRMAEGKLLDETGNPLSPECKYRPGRRLLYFREVDAEPVIPFTETILLQDDELLVACKPPFLPVTPGGRYVEECLLYRLRRRTGIDALVPLHRIDRETAGIVLFSVNPETRGHYAALFREGAVDKTYHALSVTVPCSGRTSWDLADRIVRGEPWFRMKSVAGPVNARSVITLAEVRGGMARFVLHPLTGKTHQLRLHLSGLGFGILNDRYYPELQQESADDYARPLQLLAKSIRFIDPVSGRQREFFSQRELAWAPAPPASPSPSP